jgi:rhodanese-related sulfurtransferase
LRAWIASGAEVFRDVNAPSKAFGELVDATRHTPSISAEDLQAKVRSGADLVVLDARRFEEYRVMSIPTARSVPGGELALRVRDIAPDARTLVVVNCAGRTRSIIGAQSLVNAGIPNPVAALRNGTIGWTLAGLDLEHAQSRRHASVSEERRMKASIAARALADSAGVRLIDRGALAEWSADPTRTLYRFDVRTPEEYVAGHWPGFRSAPGGQLVQETDVFAPVRGARIVLSDDDGVRANMTGSWLAQMGWEVRVLESSARDAVLERGPASTQRSPLPSISTIGIDALAELVSNEAATIIDEPERRLCSGTYSGCLVRFAQPVRSGRGRRAFAYANRLGLDRWPARKLCSARTRSAERAACLGTLGGSRRVAGRGRRDRSRARASSVTAHRCVQATL